MTTIKISLNFIFKIVLLKLLFIIEFAIIWSRAEIVSFVFLVGLFVVGTNPNWNIKLIKFRAFLFYWKWARFILKSPANKMFLLITLFLRKMTDPYLYHCEVPDRQHVKIMLCDFCYVTSFYEKLEALQSRGFRNHALQYSQIYNV